MTLNDVVSTIKDFFTLAKDLFVGVLVGALLIWPSGLNNKLKQAGFTQGNFGMLTWEATQTAQNVSQAKQGVQDVTGALEQFTADPRYAKDERLRQILEALKNSEASITSADSTLKTTVAQQHAVQGTPTNSASPGWIMLGRIDQARQKWVTTNLSVAAGSPYGVAPGQEVQLGQTPVYLREEGVAGQRAAAPIRNVVAAGTKVKIVQLDAQSHALAGGWFVWAEVTVE